MCQAKPQYLISAIAYEEAPHIGHISCLEVRSLQGEKVGPATLLTRGDVVDMIDREYDVRTLYRDPEGHWKPAQVVRKVEMRGGTFLRSDGNSIAADNLASLLEFDAAIPAAVPRF